MAPRYEFRVFGDTLAAEQETLCRSATVAGAEESRTDSYFVVPGRADASLKLRGGKFDLKVLREREDGLELWEPAAEAGFPIAPRTLRGDFLGPAGVHIDLPDRPVDRDLLLALGRAAPAICIVPVEKHRRRYCVNGVAAEFTRVSVEGPSGGRRPVESIAVEEADRGQSIATVTALGLRHRRNTSYQRFLVEMLFKTPGPDKAGN